jgi:hypothetical protein
MKSQRIRRKIEGGGDRAGRHARGTGFNEQAEHIEAIILGEGGQRRDDICLFHISTIIELSGRRQAIFQ